MSGVFMKWEEHLLDVCHNDGMKDKYNSKKAINTMPCKRGIALRFCSADCGSSRHYCPAVRKGQ